MGACAGGYYCAACCGNRGAHTACFAGNETPGVETEETKPSEPSAPSESTKPDDTHKQLTYAEYLALDAFGRQAYVESFPSMEEAMLWYESAKKTYDESKDTIDISGGDIDLGDIIEGMGK